LADDVGARASDVLGCGRFGWLEWLEEEAGEEAEGGEEEGDACSDDVDVGSLAPRRYLFHSPTLRASVRPAGAAGCPLALALESPPSLYVSLCRGGILIISARRLTTGFVF
jgi:hypothetical protein